MSSTTPAFELNHVSMFREERVILDDINWRVERGEHWALMGPNGCGKTSLLHALLGYLPSSSGSIEVLGRRFGAYDWRELRKQVGTVGSAVRDLIDPSERAVDIVASGTKALINTWEGFDEKDLTRGRDLLEKFGIDRLAESRWATLSQGEKQKVLMSRAMMSGHEILFLDEPCAGLDPRAREEFLLFLETVVERAETTIILVTHDVEEIVPLFTKTHLIKEGRTLFAGDTAAALTSEHATELFGISAAVERGDDGRFRLSARL